MALAPALVLFWPCPRASSCRDGEDNYILPQVARRGEAAGSRSYNPAVHGFSMGGKEEDDDYKCTPTRTDWLNDCHRQLLEANLLALTLLAEKEGGGRRHARGVADAGCQVVS